jgi:peptide/nickel transport system substrate-binding protein
MREIVRILVAVVVVALLLSACGKSNGGSSSAGSGSTGVETSSGNVSRGGTLLVAMDQNPKDFDPMVAGDVYSDAVVSNVVEGLYDYDENLKPVPWLAESVDLPDNLTYVFHMRKGIKFQDGTEMDADAVKFSVDRVRTNPKSTGYSDGKPIADTIVVDKYTFKLTLSEPYAPLPSRLTGRLGGIVSPAAVKAMGDDGFNQHPVGTGPFKFGEFKNDSYVRVERFDGYWRQGADGKSLPYLDRIEWRVITEPAARLTALQAGDVHISSIRDQDAPIVKKDASLNYAQQAGRSFSGVMLTIDKPPFDNKALRQAFQFAVDRKEIVSAVYEGNREVANGMIPPVLSWAIDPGYQPYTYDPAKAKAKLVEGGKPNGFEFTIWAAAGNSITQQLMELMQAQLAKVGIKMNIELADFNGVVVPKWKSRESNAYSIGISGGVDPDQFVASTFQAGDAFNFFPYDNSLVNDLIKQGRVIPDIETRAGIYKKMVPLIMEDSPYIFLTYGIDRYVGNKKVQGWFLGTKATSGYSEFWLQQ